MKFIYVRLFVDGLTAASKPVESVLCFPSRLEHEQVTNVPVVVSRGVKYSRAELCNSVEEEKSAAAADGWRPYCSIYLNDTPFTMSRIVICLCILFMFILF
jgi:hypothetical protein